MAELDGKSEKRQDAYRRERGAETQLIEFRDFIREATNDGHCIYAASADIDSAFDTVSHELLAKTAGNMKVSPFICRYIYAWLVKRLLAVRLRTPTGRWLSARDGSGGGFRKAEYSPPSSG